MAFDGIITNAVVQELNHCLIGGKIDKIFEPNKNEIILGIYSEGMQYSLAINIDSNSYCFHLTTTAKPNPLVAPNFCMLLRKHILGYRIKNISTSGLERIVFLELEGRNELNDLTTKKLVIELMGKHSNILLLTDKDVIIDSLRHIDNENSTRQILPAHFYELPANNKRNFADFSEADFISTFEAFSTNFSVLVKEVASLFTGFSIPFVEQLLQKLESGKEDIIKKLYQELHFILDNLNSTHISCALYENKKGKQDYIITKQDKSSSLEINYFLDDFYSQKEATETFVVYRNSLLKIILDLLGKYKIRLKNINAKLLEASDREKYRLYGELLTTNLYRIQENTDKITIENYYDNNSPITIALDKTLSPALNAKKFFKKYSKLKNAEEIATTQKKETLEELNYLESVIYELENCSSLPEINAVYEELIENGILQEKKKIKKSKKENKKKEFSISPVTINGFSVYIGKNNKQNDYLTTKLAY